MANLAEAIQGLVHHMRTEQQMIRDWADEQSKLNRDLRRFMELLARESSISDAADPQKRSADFGTDDVPLHLRRMP